jgi:hypothetical protein
LVQMQLHIKPTVLPETATKWHYLQDIWKSVLSSEHRYVALASFDRNVGLTDHSGCGSFKAKFPQPAYSVQVKILNRISGS